MVRFPRSGRTEGPAAEKFDLDQCQSVVAKDRPHFGDVHAGSDRAGHILVVQADPGEPGCSGGFAPLDERIPGWFDETRARQGEETRDQTGKLRGPRRGGLSHGWPSGEHYVAAGHARLPVGTF